MGSENLSQNRIYRCAPLGVTECGLFCNVIAPNAMIGEWRNCFESALKPCPMISFFLLWKRPRDVENVITSEIRVTTAAMIFEFARAGALFCCNVPILGKYRLALHFESTIVYVL